MRSGENTPPLPAAVRGGGGGHCWYYFSMRTLIETNKAMPESLDSECEHIMTCILSRRAQCEPT